MKWSDEDGLENPAFAGVTISGTSPQEVVSADGYVKFIGTYRPEVFAKGSAHKDVLFFGDENKLFWPNGEDATTIGSQHAYFLLLKGLMAGDHSGLVKEFKLNFDGLETGLAATDYSDEAGAWYDLSGRKVKSGPLPRGVFINKGRKVLVK